MAFELDAERQVEIKELISELHFTQYSLFGDIGSSDNRLRVINYDGRFGLIRCKNGYVEQTRIVLATIYTIGESRAAFRVLGVSGTIKGATEKYIPQLRTVAVEEKRKRVELEEISGSIVRIRGREIDIFPEDLIEGSDTRYVGLTSFDLDGGHDDADGTSNGL